MLHDERPEETTIEEALTSRRTLAKGAAAGGLVALFGAVASGRVLAQGDEDDDSQGENDDTQGEDDTTGDEGAGDDTTGDDSADDTTGDDAADDDTTGDDDQAGAGQTTSDKSRKRKKHRKRGKGRKRH